MNVRDVKIHTISEKYFVTTRELAAGRFWVDDDEYKRTGVSLSSNCMELEVVGCELRRREPKE